MSQLAIIIMAGGLGKRMQSDLPKVLHLIGGKPMIVRVLEQALRLDPVKIMVVVGKFREVIKNEINKFLKLDENLVTYVDQPVAMGTGHAVSCCIPYLSQGIIDKSCKILILSGDVPLLESDTMTKFYEATHDHGHNLGHDIGCAIMTTHYEDPHGYGRIIKDDNNKFLKIVEEKDCTKEQRQIKETNCGTYIIKTEYLLKYLPKLSSNNAQNEYYLTDIIGLIREFEGTSILTYQIPEHIQYQLSGVNTKDQLDNLRSQLLIDR